MAMGNLFRPLKRGLSRFVYARAWRLLEDDSHALASVARLRSRIDGESVALVGNARALLTSGSGAAIDAHDFIMRFNLGLIAQPEHQGSRTDIVGVSSSGRPRKIFAGFHGAPVFWLSGRRERMRPGFLRRIDELTVIPIETVESLRQQLGAKPSSGIIALATMRSFEPKSITLFGFDWKRTPSLYNDRIGVHDWAAEAALVHRWQAEDSRLTIMDPAVRINP